jgi:hypothetical protein
MAMWAAGPPNPIIPSFKKQFGNFFLKSFVAH